MDNGVSILQSSSADHPDGSSAFASSAAIAHSWDDEQKKRTTDVTAPISLDSSLDHLTDMRFADLQISPAVLKGLADAGFSRPSPVQLKAIPLGRLGLDLIVQAKSGTGKTVVFVVVLLDAVDPQRPALQALVLSPTREIALQSQIVIQRLSAHLPGLKCQLFVGGLPIADDLRHLHQCHIAVGTPGRIRYLIETGYMAVDQVRHLVLDEADILLAGGAEASVTGGSANNAFPADVNYIWWSLPESKQVMAFSATYSDYLAEAHLQRYTNNPALIRLSSHDPALLGVRQFFCLVEVKDRSPASVFAAKVSKLCQLFNSLEFQQCLIFSNFHSSWPDCCFSSVSYLGVRQFFCLVEVKDRSPASVFAAKVSKLCQLFNSLEFQQCLIFSNFHSSAQDLCDSLRSRGWPVSYISSTLDQDQRFRAYNSLRSFHCRVLVSTDLTSRGIDAENVNLVVSLEVPWEPEIYVHRVGRAGRFGSYGASIMIVSDLPEERQLLMRLQSKCPTQIVQLPDPVPADLAAPDCAIDLDSLVTVVNCVNSSTGQSKPPAGFKTSSSRQKRESPPEPPSYVVAPDGDPPMVHNNTNVTKFENQSTKAHSASSWSQFPHKLTQYLDAVNTLEVGQVPNDSPLISTLNQLEAELLQELGEHCANGFTQFTNAYPTEEAQDTKLSHVAPSAVTKELPRKEPPKHRREPTPPSENCANLEEGTNPPHGTATAESAQFQWSAQQLSAWYEYQKLMQYARWYHAAWASAMEQYNSAVERLNQARIAETADQSTDSEDVYD
ncbi:unnamed protein product [Dicrocoelium dendriticum]|nr:unnamed protein product [Dicrocoelium dendriticum]